MRTDVIAPSATGAPRMRVLSVISSSNQMYSGIGRNLFELARRMTGRVAYEFAIDDGTSRNTDLVVDFAREIGAPVHVGRATREPLALDAGNADLPALLERGQWDAIECVCFANTATNAAVLEGLGSRLLYYTPHDQPLWTVPMSVEQESHVAAVHRRMVRSADVVLCDSRVERANLQALAPDRNNAYFVPLGCDFAQFRPDSKPRREQLLFVGDLVEHRKRFDRVLAALGVLLPRRPGLRLLVIGNRGEEFRDRIPEPLRGSVELVGYVDEERLRRAYAESAGFVLFSEYEAFGIPILEALASRTPAFLSRLDTTFSLFSIYRGAIFCEEDDAVATASRIEAVLEAGPEFLDGMRQDEYHLRSTFGWKGLAARKWELMAAAWFRRNGFAMAG